MHVGRERQTDGAGEVCPGVNSSSRYRETRGHLSSVPSDSSVPALASCLIKRQGAVQFAVQGTMFKKLAGVDSEI